MSEIQLQIYAQKACKAGLCYGIMLQAFVEAGEANTYADDEAGAARCFRKGSIWKKLTTWR